jgi:PAS domain S-box-containing protein
MNIDIENNILIHAIEHSNLAHTISRITGDMELIYVNQAFLDQTGYERDEVLKRNCRFLQGEGTNPDTVDLIRKAIANFKSIDIEILNYKKDGTPFWNRLRMSPVYDDENNPIAFIGVQSDVTHIHEQNRIEQERQKLEALGRLTGNISHEIKNALQPVKLMAEHSVTGNHLMNNKLSSAFRS